MAQAQAVPAKQPGKPVGGARFPFSLRMPDSRAANLGIFIVKRILWMIPVIFFVVLVTFMLAHMASGSPWDKGGGRQLSDAVKANLNAKYGLDKPIWEQFLLYIWNIAHFDFGPSYQYQGKQVSALLIQSWPPTMTIGALAFLLIVPVGIGLGVIAALRQNTFTDYLTMGFSMFGAAVPSFVVGMMLIVIFAVELDQLTGGAFSLPAGRFAYDPQHLIMPVVTLAVLPIAYIARLTRSSTLDTIRQDYVRTAWAKGLPERLVVLKHILKNSLIPAVTALGPTFAFLVTGSVIVETVFAIPGIGGAFVVAVDSRDYPMILATTVQYAIIIALANLVVDLLYVVIDPRVRLE